MEVILLSWCETVTSVARGRGENALDDVVTHRLGGLEDATAELGFVVPTESHRVVPAGGEEFVEFGERQVEDSEDVRVEAGVAPVVDARGVGAGGDAQGALGFVTLVRADPRVATP